MKMKNLIINILKLGLVAALLGWLIQSGKLNLAELSIFLERPEISIFSILFWLVGPTLLGSLRWRLLVNGAGYSLSYIKAIMLQTVGFFFNSAMPGSVGGDVVKVFYIVKEHPKQGKTNAMMTVVMDRVLGMCGLFLMGFMVMLFTGTALLEQPAIQAQFYLMSLVTVGMVLFLTLSMFPHKDGKDPILKFLQLGFPGFNIIKKIYESFRLYSQQKAKILACIAISFFIQFLGFLLFSYISATMINFDNASALAIFFPIGILTTALPLAPGGIGVGHMAFDKLFLIVGVNGGANVFNVFVLGQLALNLTGLIPYMLLKKKSTLGSHEANAALNIHTNAQV